MCKSIADLSRAPAAVKAVKTSFFATLLRAILCAVRIIIDWER
jgi:hypothetical protein